MFELKEILGRKLTGVVSAIKGKTKKDDRRGEQRESQKMFQRKCLTKARKIREQKQERWGQALTRKLAWKQSTQV